MKYQWRGNVRELRNVIERAVVIAKGPMITPNDLPVYVVSQNPLPLKRILEDMATQGTLAICGKGSN